MDATPRRVLVTGATGRCGQPVVARLLEAGVAVRALTRSPDGDAARALRSSGAEVVRGDMLRPGTLGPAVDGVERVYLITTSEHGFDEEVEGARNVVEAAQAAGASYLVVQSVVYADTAMPHCATKGAVERLLRQGPLPWASLRAGYFLETVPHYLTGAGRDHRIPCAVRPSAPMWWVSVADLALAAVRLLTASRPVVGAFDAVARDPMSMERFAALLGELTGRPWECDYLPMSVERLLTGVVLNGFMTEEKRREFLAGCDDPEADYYAPVSEGAVVCDPAPLEEHIRMRFRSPSRWVREHAGELGLAPDLAQ